MLDTANPDPTCDPRSFIRSMSWNSTRHSPELGIVAERVDGDRLTDTGRSRRFPASRLERFDVHVAALAPSREKPVFGRGVVGLSGGVLRAPPAA